MELIFKEVRFQVLMAASMKIRQHQWALYVKAFFAFLLVEMTRGFPHAEFCALKNHKSEIKYC
jgi:hypothetical protein